MMNSNELPSIISRWRSVIEEEKEELKIKEISLNEIRQDNTDVRRDDEQHNSVENDKENYVRSDRTVNSFSGLNRNVRNERKNSVMSVKSSVDNNFIGTPLTTKNNSYNNSRQHALSLRENDKKKLKKQLILPDVRDLEKDRLAKLCEKSPLNIGCNKSRNDVVFSLNSNSSNSTPFPTMSAREKEINRLAALFENSSTSQDRTLSCHTVEKSQPIVSLSGRVGESDEVIDVDPCGKPVAVDGLIGDDVSFQHFRPSFNENIQNSHCSNLSHEDALPSVFVSSYRDRSPSGPANVLMPGFGEYDEKRKQLVEQRKKDYSDYMRQARLQMRNSRPMTHNCCSHHVPLRDVSTQTDIGVNNNNNNNNVMNGDGAVQTRPSYLLDNDCLYSNNYNRDNKTSKGTCTSMPVSPTRSDRSNSKSPITSPRGRDLHRSVHYLPGSPFLSPTTPSGERAITDSTVDVSASNTHMKQYIYREELKKQIEERQRLEAERKEKERREEEAMERRVREQQEKLRKQYEIEEAQRLEYAMRRHLPDELLRQRLAEVDMRAMQCNYPNYAKHHRPTVLPCSNVAPFVSPDDRPLPLPDKKDKLQPKNTTNTPMMTSAINSSPNTITIAPNDTTKTAEQGAIVLNKQPSKPINLNRSNSQNNNNNFNNNNSNNNNNTKQIDPLIGVDLLADNSLNNNNINENLLNDPIFKKNDENDHNIAADLNNIGDINLNDRNHSNGGSTSPVVPAVRTKMRLASNIQLLEDKWQVPAVEKTYIRPTALYGYRPQPIQLPKSDFNNITVESDSRTNRNNYLNNSNYEFQSNNSRSDNVLTQLGSFRRQLQLEQMKLQEQSFNQHIGTVGTNQPNIKSPVSVATSRM